MDTFNVYFTVKAAIEKSIKMRFDGSEH